MKIKEIYMCVWHMVGSLWVIAITDRLDVIRPFCLLTIVGTC
jgi:hypothetical protein